MSEYLFAYGTLQPGLAPAEVAAAVAQLQPVGEGSVPGLLYDLGGYPGAVLDPCAHQKVFGTVFRLPQDLGVLRQLDEYEGFNPNSPDASLFVRSLHPVELATGGSLPCWVYVYHHDPDFAPVLPHGRYQGKQS